MSKKTKATLTIKAVEDYLKANGYAGTTPDEARKVIAGVKDTRMASAYVEAMRTKMSLSDMQDWDYLMGISDRAITNAERLQIITRLRTDNADMVQNIKHYKLRGTDEDRAKLVAVIKSVVPDVVAE